MEAVEHKGRILQDGCLLCRDDDLTDVVKALELL